MTTETTPVETTPEAFAHHPGYRRMFAPGRLTLGLMQPIEAYSGSVATLRDNLERVRQAEAAGFAAVWLRDVPLHDPYFGDSGQVYDPWVYLGFLAAQTRNITLATGAIILPLRHPLHVAKAAASVDQLTGGRLVLGVASGDRPLEYPAFGADFEGRGERFEQALDYFHQALERSFPVFTSPLGAMAGDVDLLPKPAQGRIPVLITGASRHAPDWIAGHADGWLQYARSFESTTRLVAQWRGLVADGTPGLFKPFAQAFGLDLDRDPAAPPRPIHNGFSVGRRWLHAFLEQQQEIGVNHVLFGLKYGRRPAQEVLDELTEHILSDFPALAGNAP